jgi:hypothetical protein
VSSAEEPGVVDDSSLWIRKLTEHYGAIQAVQSPACLSNSNDPGIPAKLRGMTRALAPWPDRLIETGDRAWQTAIRHGSTKACRNDLSRFSDGRHAIEAQKRLGIIARGNNDLEAASRLNAAAKRRSQHRVGNSPPSSFAILVIVNLRGRNS